MNREDFLKYVGDTVGNRGESYGDAKENFERVCKLWQVVLGVDISAAQFAQMMICLKVARLNATPGHTDSWIDIAGYAALAAEVVDDD